MTETSTDPFHLDRFVRAQDDDGMYERALGELGRGRKTTHWIWFVFPQLAGLGHSPTAQYYAISSLDEARAYTEHPVLGPRLTESTQLVAESDAASADAIFGDLDAMKVKSSMTLFVRTATDHDVFQRVLDKYYGGETDGKTDQLLQV